MAKYKLLLPKMGESVAEATIIRWTKNPGDDVAVDETVMEIATDKVDSDVPSPVAGKLTEQLFRENDVVQVGSVIAIIETPEVEKETNTPPLYNAFHEPQPESNSPGEVAAPGTPAPVLHEKTTDTAQPPAGTDAPLISSPQPVFEERSEVLQPVPYTEQLTPPAQPEEAQKPSGRFYSPLVKSIAAQEGVSVTELDKIAGTGAEGRLTKDDLLAFIDNRLQQVLNKNADVMPEAAQPEPVQNQETKPVTGITDDLNITEKLPDTAHAPAMPEKELEPAEPGGSSEPVKTEPVIPATQPVHQPVAEEIPAVKPAASLSGGDEIIEMDRMRRLTAEHMVMSRQTSAHVTSFVEADVTNLVKWREKIKAVFEKREGVKLTLTPLFIEAVAKAIKDMPMINVSVSGTQIIKKKDVNISMATALANGNLIVPVIKHADELNLLGLAKAVNDLADRARNNKLKPDDVQGGTFTFTNVGSFGNVMGTPIINQPQVAILAVGAIRKKPAVIETLEGDMIGIRHMMFLSLSYDHRVVDGALGGSFVRRVADYLENWDSGREI